MAETFPERTYADMEPESSATPPPKAEIIPAQPTEIQHQSVEFALKRANEWIQKRKGLVKLIAANIDPRDVVIYGKSPKETIHYAKNACKQILSWIEADIVDVSITETRYTGKEGPYIIFDACGTLLLPGGRKINIMGNRATFDDFFGREYGRNKPLEEVDIPSVRLAAITNMWNHALEDAGLKPSLEELRDAGLDMKKASYVEFKKGEEPQPQQTQSQQQKPTQSAPPSNGHSNGDTISEAQAKRLFAIARNQGYTPDEYRSILYNEFNVSHDTDLKKAHYQKAEKLFCENRRS